MPARQKKDDDQAIGRSKGGLSTKIHTLVDALGNPLAFDLAPGQQHDLAGADVLLPQMAADTLLADKSLPSRRRGPMMPTSGSSSRSPGPAKPPSSHPGKTVRRLATSTRSSIGRAT